MFPDIPDLSLWVQRIQDQAPDQFRFVGLGGDLQNQYQNLAAEPAVFVVPNGDSMTELSASLPRGTNRHLINTIIGMRSYGQTKGERVVDEIRLLRLALRAALYQWRPDGCEDTVTYVRGQSLEPRFNAFWWIDTYQFTTYS